jgi:hypothetical protein
MRKLEVTNDRATYITLWLEPWGEDYGMLPGDAFEIVAGDAGEGFYFHVVNGEKGVTVYAEGGVRQISVYHKGAELSCGHNRREDTW